MASPACFWRGLTIVTVTLVRVTVYSDSDCEMVISNCRLQRMLTFSREPASSGLVQTSVSEGVAAGDCTA
jgi:hypothetical protein